MLIKGKHIPTNNPEALAAFLNKNSHLTTTEIAQKYGISTWMVRYLRRKSGDVRESPLPVYHKPEQDFLDKELEANVFSYAEGSVTDPEIWDNYDWLYQKYVNEELSERFIGRIVSVSKNTIRKRLKRYGIRIRGFHEAVACKSKVNNYEWLSINYEQRLRSIADMARDAGVGWETMKNWLMAAGIKIRNHGEAVSITNFKRLGRDEPNPVRTRFSVTCKNRLDNEV